MKTILTSITTLVIISFLFYAFTIGENNTQVYNSNANSISGAELYKKNCSVCHGVDRQGSLPAFPSLRAINKRMKKTDILNLLTTGRNAMPSFKYLTKEERNAIVGYLLGEKTESKVVSTFNPIEAGKNLFIANCASCHKVTSKDAEPMGVRNYGMRPAILGGINRKHDFYRFERILNMGPCYMPSFENLGVKDKENIYKYLSSFDIDNYYRNNCRMNCMKHPSASRRTSAGRLTGRDMIIYIDKTCKPLEYSGCSM